MKIVSFNIGLKIDNSLKVAKFLKELDADVVCLQEVIRHFSPKVFPKYKSKSIIDSYLSKIYPYCFFGPQWISKAVFQNGKLHRNYGGFIEQGNYILSKYPIISAQNKHYFKNYSLEIDHTNFEKIDHPRSVVIATLNIRGKKLIVLTLHGTFSGEKKDTKRSLKQAEFLINTAKEYKNLPIILSGDFNVTPDTKTTRLLSNNFKNIMEDFEIKTTLPHPNKNIKKKNQTIDYFFVNKYVKSENLEVYKTNISDHLPVIFEFSI